MKRTCLAITQSLLLAYLFVLPAFGQDLARIYDEARFRVVADRILKEIGPRVNPRQPDHVILPSDSISVWIAHFGPLPEALPIVEVKPAFVLDTFKVVRKLESVLFQDRFEKTKWAFLGSNSVSRLDTTRTQVLRAMLEAAFGPPTRTLVELENLDSRGREEFIQFEYWFILNDSIPFVLSDVNGPGDRGMVVSTDHRLRPILKEMREAFLDRMLAQPFLKPYVDYYYQYDQRAWYKTGFDGAFYFMRRISRPELQLGRPFIDPDGHP